MNRESNKLWYKKWNTRALQVTNFSILLFPVFCHYPYQMMDHTLILNIDHNSNARREQYWLK